MAGSGYTPEQCSGSGDEDEGFGDIGSLFEIAQEASVLDQPGEAALDDPAPRQRLEARQGAGSFDDLEVEMGLSVCPVDELAGVAAVGKHGAHEAPETAGGAQQRLGAIAVLDARGMDFDGQDAPVGVGQYVALAPRDLLARVVAFRAPF